MTETHIGVAQSMIDLDALTNVKYLNRVVKEKTDTSHPDIVAFYRKMQKELAARGYPFIATEFHRTAQRQEQLYLDGVTRARAGASPHQWGCAVEVVHWGRYWDLSKKEWAIVGAIGKEVARKAKIKVTWGGDWNFYDPAHWEMTDWRRYRQAAEYMIAHPEIVDNTPTLDHFQRLDLYCKWERGFGDETTLPLASFIANQNKR